jgi:hypothetical protein
MASEMVNDSLSRSDLASLTLGIKTYHGTMGVWSGATVQGGL